MPYESTSLSPVVKLALKALVNVALVVALDRLLPQYFSVFGGPAAYVILGALFTLLNLFLRPILTVITFPFRLVAHIITAILVNAFFLWVVHEIVLRMDPGVVAMAITGGFVGWMVVSLTLGISNWVMKHVL